MGKGLEFCLCQRFDFLCFSSTDWYGWWGSRQQIMMRLAKRGHRVLFVEQLAGIEHLIKYPELRKRRLSRLKEGFLQVEKNINVISPPPLLPGRYYLGFINRINMLMIRWWIKPYIRRLGFRNPILWVYKPEHSALIGRMKEVLSVYHCIDEWTAGTTGRKRMQISGMDSKLASKVSMVLSNSLPSFNKKSQLNENTYRVPSGVDFQRFSQVTNPEYSVHPAIVNIPKPIIGYSGTINERLDYDALEFLAATRPEWSLVFVGDPYPWTMKAAQLHRLSRLSNVFFLGKFPHDEMPSLLKGMDVCILPYIDDERGYYRSPLKLYEYLAAGKPIVSMAHPEAKEFESVIQLAENKEDFIQKVQEEIGISSKKQTLLRQGIARKHSWEKRVDKIEDLLCQYIKNHE